MSKNVITVHDAKGALKHGFLRFVSPEEDFDSYELQKKKRNAPSGFLIEPANIARHYTVPELLHALIFYPNLQKYPDVLFAVTDRQRKPLDLQGDWEVRVCIIITNAVTGGSLMCPGCGHNGNLKTEIFGRGVINNLGVLQQVRRQDCEIDGYAKRYFCTKCGITGHRGGFEYADFREVAIVDARQNTGNF